RWPQFHGGGQHRGSGPSANHRRSAFVQTASNRLYLEMAWPHPWSGRHRSRRTRVLESLAVVGATGAVGRIILELLEARGFPAARVKLLASKRSAGSTIRFRGENRRVEELRPEAFDGVDLAIGSTPDEVARGFAPWAVERGCTVVDESGYWRMDPKVPLVIPEVNAEALERHQGIIASPNCSTTQMVVALKPLHDAARVKRVVVSTYQATSGAGVAGQRDLDRGTRSQIDGAEY